MTCKRMQEEIEELCRGEVLPRKNAREQGRKNLKTRESKQLVFFFEKQRLRS